MRKTAGLLGISAFVIFWAASFIFGALRPGYSYIINTVSELGAIGTTHAILWNIFGFIVPGLFLAVTGGVFAQSVRNEKSRAINFSCLLLVLAGIAVAGQGIIPAEMVNGVAVVTSFHTRGHLISSLISGIAWIIGVLLLVKPMKRSPEWQGWHIVSIVTVILMLIASFTLRSVLPGGLAQRAGDMIFFAWYILISIKLIQTGHDTSE